MFINNEARTIRDLMVQQLREARLSSVQISRLTENEPYFSQISYVDLEGNSKTFYQQERKLWMADWTENRKNLSNANLLTQREVSRFNAFYPDQKNYSHMVFMFYLHNQPSNNKFFENIAVFLTGDVDFKNQ